jgi:hypothetical protein
VIGTVVLAGLQGLAKSLGERLVAAPKQAVAMRELADEVRELRVEHYKNQAAVTELLRQFERVVSQTDGLTLAGASIEFTQTTTSPTLGDALLSLERRIEELGRVKPDPSQQKQQATPSPRPASVFDGLDDEIRQLRESGRKND